MMLSSNTKFLIVGLGLLGGSYAEALTKKGYAVEAITLEQADIDYALKKGIIRAGGTKVEPERVAAADIVIFALYPRVFIEWIARYQQFFRPGAIITDVTGVKCGVVREVQQMLRDDVEFIAAHPMAGRERSGVRYADASVFRGANYLVVPTEQNSERAISVCASLGETLGFGRITRITPEKHDRMIAYLSQLTHCIAVSLMCTQHDEGIENYTGDSFRDLTRIAKINDVMWSELFLWNRAELLRQMALFEEQFTRLRRDLENEDVEDMRAMMRLSTERRSLFDQGGSAR